MSAARRMAGLQWSAKQEKVEPKETRPPWAAMPITAAHMANSRTPKKTLRPAGSSWKLASGLKNCGAGTNPDFQFGCAVKCHLAGEGRVLRLFAVNHFALGV